MADREESLFGGRPWRDNLAAAIERGHVIRAEDGSLTLPASTASHNYLHVKAPADLGCAFTNHFLFKHVYAGTAVPYGCRACFKVKIVPRTLRELVALRGLLERLDYHSKCGVDFNNPHSQDFYAGFLYLHGLDEARAAYRDIRARVDADPKLGAAVGMTIKRGCTNYEVACGPSDKYEFPDEMAVIEAELRPKFRKPVAPPRDYRIRRAESMVVWIEFAFRLKDDTYLEFTGGKPLHPRTVAYPPESPAGETA